MANPSTDPRHHSLTEVWPCIWQREWVGGSFQEIIRGKINIQHQRLSEYPSCSASGHRLWLPLISAPRLSRWLSLITGIATNFVYLSGLFWLRANNSCALYRRYPGKPVHYDNKCDHSDPPSDPWVDVDTLVSKSPWFIGLMTWPRSEGV